MHISERLVYGTFAGPVTFIVRRDNGVAQPLELICDKIQSMTGTQPLESEVVTVLEELVQEGSLRTHPNGEGVTLYELTPDGFRRKRELEHYLRDVIMFKKYDSRRPGTRYGVWWQVILSNGIVWSYFSDNTVEHIDREGLRIPLSLVMSRKAHNEIHRRIVEAFTLEGRAS